MTPTSPSPEKLRRRGLRLVWATIFWNVFEVFITIGLGVAAGSIALVAFGTDSMVEVFASLVVVWHSRDLLVMEETHRTRRSLLLIAVSFVVLGAVLIVGAGFRLIEGSVPDESPLGIAYLAITAFVMLALAILKQRTAVALASDPLAAEARITYLDAGLAASVLLSLVLNAAFGWWWADPVAALAIAGIALREGHEHWEESRAMVPDAP
ncbi:MAG: cation transporter [Acidimicrobiia bacterium]|nr:cation transporter [Acidimicrobiia bacterium]